MLELGNLIWDNSKIWRHKKIKVEKGLGDLKSPRQKPCGFL